MKIARFSFRHTLLQTSNGWLRMAFLHDGRIQWFDELDVTKESIRRLRLRSKQVFPDSFSILVLCMFRSMAR